MTGSSSFPEEKSALVLFSGGQDSTTCLAWALARYDRVETVGFDYGQRNAVELDCRPKVLESLRTGFPEWARKLGDDRVLDLTFLGGIAATAMTSNAEIGIEANGLPNTFVPGRNLLFLTVAAALAYGRRIRVLVGGMCETDFSGYPDCRDATIKALQHALDLGMDTHFQLRTPLMWITKGQTWKLAQELGGMRLIEIIREQTHTCYLGDRTNHNEWGYGCGACPACRLRAAGYAEFSAGEVRL